MCKADTPLWSFRKEQDPLTLSYPLEYNENGAHPQSEAAALISSGNHLHAYLDKLQSDPETLRATHTLSQPTVRILHRILTSESNPVTMKVSRQYWMTINHCLSPANRILPSDSRICVRGRTCRISVQLTVWKPGPCQLVWHRHRPGLKSISDQTGVWDPWLPLLIQELKQMH